MPGKVPYALTFIGFVIVLRDSPMGFKRRVYQLFGGSLTALTLSVLPAFAEELDNWEFDTSNSELTFSLSDQVFPEFFLLSEPARLVLDIPNTEIGDVEPDQIYSGTTVQAIRVAQYTPEKVRIVIELAPEVVLAPEQADIQFDSSGDGQRHWRFRPLVAGDTAGATTLDGTPDSSPETDSENGEISLSAANLEPSQQPPTSATLPLDPYESDASGGVVSVPPLEQGVNVPPLAEGPEEGVEESSESVAIAADAEPPELPPMTVPELEAVELEDAELPTQDVETRPSSLPELEVSASTVPPDVAAPDDSSNPTHSQTTPEESAASSDAVESVSPSVNESASDNTETALAPQEASEPMQQPAAVSDEVVNSTAQTIQQPVAERTIMQTDMPAPLPFGQPLPD